MIKTTRIKYSQAPRIIVDDLSPQCDGVKQTFTLTRPVPEWAPYCLVFNGQLYTNTSYKQWFVLDADRKTIHTSFITPPTQGPNKSLILIVGVAGMEDLGVTWDDIVNKPEILTEEEIDSKDAAVLAEAKQYTDEHGGSQEDSLFYINVTNVDFEEETFTADKTHAEILAAYNAGKLPIVIVKEEDSGHSYDGIYMFRAHTVFEGDDGFDFGYVDATGNEGRVDAGSWSIHIGSQYSRAIKSYGSVEIDSALNQYSDHAVKNSAIYNALSQKANQGDLATVATSGSYNDLSDKPTVPTFTLTATDPGEGATLAANTFIGVYNG